MGRRWLLGILLAGCPAESSPDDVGYQSGSRIRVEFFEGEGGARAFNRLWDTELETECSFAHTEDGTIRCVPVVEVSGYADANCTQPVAVAECDAAKYAIERIPEADPCVPWRARIHEIGEALAIANTYGAGSGSCVAGFPLEAGSTAYAVGDVVSAQLFVAGDAAYEKRGDELELGVIRAEDGTRAPWQLRDLDRAQACVIERLNAPDEYWCFPFRRATAWSQDEIFADAACTQQVASTTLDCGVPDVGFYTETDLFTFENTISLFTPGSQLAPESLYRKFVDCSPAAPEDLDEGAYYQVGPPLDPSVFPRVVKRRQGSDRLQRYEYGTVDGAPLVAGRRFYDPQLDVDCDVRRFVGDDLRCIPVDAVTALEADVRFADDSCTVRVVPSDAPDRIAVLYGAARCPYEAEQLIPLGEPYHGLLYARVSTGCVQVVDALPRVYYHLSDLPLDPSAFPAVSRID